MATRITGAAFMRSALITITLGAMLSACGGSSSSNRNQQAQDLLLDSDTRGLAVRSVTYDLWQLLNVQRWAAVDAFDYYPGRCPEDSDLQEPDNDSRIITFSACSKSYSESGSDWSEESVLTINGSVSQHQDTASGGHTSTFDDYSFLDTGDYWSQWQNNGEDISYHETWEYGATINGSLTFSGHQYEVTTERFTFDYVDQYTETENNIETYSQNERLNYTLRDFALNSTREPNQFDNTYDGHGHISRRLDNGILDFEFDIVTSLTRTYSTPFPCLTSGELLLTDSKGNTLGVLFSDAEVTFTLNNVGETITCQDFAEELGLEFHSPV